MNSKISLPNHKVFIGFDFSINKPACTIILNNKPKFFIWPINLTSKEQIRYSETDISVYNRNLEPVSKKGKNSTSNLVEEHTRRSVDLAEKIVDDIQNYIFTALGEKDEWTGEYIIRGSLEEYISSEGLSFGSKGNSVLDLATYKGVLLAEIYRRMKPTKIFTYAPITIKKVAGVEKSKDFQEKFPMIEKFKNEPIDCIFKSMLTKGEMLAKTNYMHCVDDIVDSYFCCKTMYKKEKMSGVEFWDE